MNSQPKQRTDISVTKLYLDSLILNVSPRNSGSLLRYQLQEGIELLLWQSYFTDLHKFNVHDDLGRIYFTCALNGESNFSLKHQRHLQNHSLSGGSNCINYTPDCHAISHYNGQFDSIMIAMEPNSIETWGVDIGHHLRTQLNSKCCYQQQNSHAEIHATATSLFNTLKRMHQLPGTIRPNSRLWLMGQSMVLFSLMLEQYHKQPATNCRLSYRDQEKLLQAKDRLLADLTQAPTIATLAHETGLSVLKIKRGFRQLFNNTVYGTFQEERMKEAKRRLSTGNVQVMTVAADLGYANASHFTAAFQKQFGVNPSAFKRCF
jgi:AraC family transcriptional regulator